MYALPLVNVPHFNVVISARCRQHFRTSYRAEGDAQHRSAVAADLQGGCRNGKFPKGLFQHPPWGITRGMTAQVQAGWSRNPVLYDSQMVLYSRSVPIFDEMQPAGLTNFDALLLAHSAALTCSVRVHLTSAISHTFAVLSSLPEASHFESLLNATQRTGLLWACAGAGKGGRSREGEAMSMGCVTRPYASV